MEKNSKKGPFTGAKKAGRVLSILALATTMAFANPMTAAAYVDASDVIGEEQLVYESDYYGDRAEYKLIDAQDIDNFFRGYDRYGDRYVYPEQIRKAIEMSNVLNAYNNYDSYSYSNTTKVEVLGLDIDAMYRDFERDAKYGYRHFCRQNIGNKPAIDAYLNFACGTISESIKTTIAENVYVDLLNQGYRNITMPRIERLNDKLYAVLLIDGYYNIVEIKTRHLPELKNVCDELDGRYSMCLGNIAGTSSDYPNSFAYNGVDRVTGESAWLSLGDDYLKNYLLTALDYQDQFERGLEISVNTDARFFVYDEQEIKALKEKGYSRYDIGNMTRMDAQATLERGLVK